MPNASVKRRPAKAAKAPKVTGRTIWHFGPGGADGDAQKKALLGGKGANLAEMCRLGLPVPPGFTIDTSVCERYTKNGGRIPADVVSGVKAAMARLEKE